jgi:DNA-binding NarL/FixJ family response regulator
MRKRILVIDDNTAFRGALAQVLETERFAVVAEAATGASGVQLAREHEPDLVIVDVQLPDTDGFDVAEQLAALELPMEVILTSGLHLTDLGTLVAESSARGFVPKAELSVGAIKALLGEGAETSPFPIGDSGFGDNAWRGR